MYAPGMSREVLERALREELMEPFLEAGAPRVQPAALQAALARLRDALMTGVTGKVRLDRKLV